MYVDTPGVKGNCCQVNGLLIDLLYAWLRISQVPVSREANQLREADLGQAGPSSKLMSLSNGV
jgi:hypothetical protein